MPISLMCTGIPAGVVLMTIFPMSSGPRAWPVISVRASWWLVSIRPGESIMLLRLIASRMLGIVTPACNELGGIRLHVKLGTCPPCTTTEETPSGAVQPRLQRVVCQFPEGRLRNPIRRQAIAENRKRCKGQPICHYFGVCGQGRLHTSQRCIHQLERPIHVDAPVEEQVDLRASPACDRS